MFFIFTLITVKKDLGRMKEKAVNLYTEPVKIEGVLDMRPLRI